MLIKKIVFAILLSLTFCFSAQTSQNMYFDANGNQISETQYKARIQAERESQEARQEAMQKAQRERAREMARKRFELRAAEEAKARESKSPNPSGSPPAPNPGKPLSAVDQIISSQRTGATTQAPQASQLNTFDCYTYNELFSMAEDLYIEVENDRCVPKKILMNGIWRESDPCGENGYKVGKRLPHIKDMQYTHNKLNKDKKTGGYRGD